MEFSAARRQAVAVGARASARGLPVGARLIRAAGAAVQREIEERRLFLWTPVAAGCGDAAYFAADREPSASFALACFAAAALAGFACRRRPALLAALVAVAAFFGGFACAGLRTRELAAPALRRIRITRMTGFIEQMDPRPRGARILLRVARADGLRADATPYRVRLTTRAPGRFRAGDFVALKARLLPPSQAEIPGGYDFARAAFFARIGAVGNVLGRMQSAAPPAPPDWRLRFFALVDRGRNRLAQRIESVLRGPAAAVAVAMVTGKRGFLAGPTKNVIRQAGIFHIITISGVQMTLVAGILFWGARRLLALSSALALRYPIKQWAAAMAMVGALAYDVATGSRVGTQRALVMTLVLLGAVVVGRRGFSMRNLAFAALIVIGFEPEALLGASFQLSFAAVAALIAFQEARAAPGRSLADMRLASRDDRLLIILERLRAEPARLLVATACATTAASVFMAFDFHEISPYVLIGNPLTLAAIELFAVPAALLGAFLYPLGLDALVWRYLGAGIDLVLWAATKIAALPGATLHLSAFPFWSFLCLVFAVLSAVIWRTTLLRLSGFPLAAIGLIGIAASPHFSVFVAPNGAAIAFRDASGRLAVAGRRVNAFAAEQWLRAARSRPPKAGEDRRARSPTARRPHHPFPGSRAR